MQGLRVDIATAVKQEQDSLVAMGSALREVARHQKVMGVGQSPRDRERGIRIDVFHQDDKRGGEDKGKGEEVPAIWCFPESLWDMERVGDEIHDRQMKP